MMLEKGYDLTMPMVVTNSADFALSIAKVNEVVAFETIVLNYSKK